jgi:adenylosuccinate lyase
MIGRYTRPEMGRIWSEDNKYRQWLAVELAASEALADLGEVPQEAAVALRKYAATSADRIAEIEREVRHDVIAFTTCVAESMAAAGVGEHSRWLHYGLTSNDVVDTAQALQIREASALIRTGLESLLGLLKEKAFEHKETIQAGRTHGIHAEPYVFGLKFAIWYDECRRNQQRFHSAADDICVGKISGAVGTFAHLSPKAEERIMVRLGLRPAPVASQVIPRDLHASYLSALALIAALCEQIALEIRHLQRTEVREAEEPFGAGQKGSSAMPHKKNPIVCEQICGLARVVRSNVQAGFENIALWHERDISHSSVERVVLPDSCVLVDYLLSKTIWLVRDMRVDVLRMRENLDLTHGLLFSGQLLLDLAAAGVLREKAYSIVQRHAMDSWRSGGNFREAIENDPEVRSHLTHEQIAEAFSIQRQLRNVAAIYDRVFSNTNR